MKRVSDSDDTSPTTLDAKRKCLNYPSSDSDDTIVVEENGGLFATNGNEPSQNAKPNKVELPKLVEPKKVEQPKAIMSNNEINDGSGEDKSFAALSSAIVRLHGDSFSIRVASFEQLCTEQFRLHTEIVTKAITEDVMILKTKFDEEIVKMGKSHGSSPFFSSNSS